MKVIHSNETAIPGSLEGTELLEYLCDQGVCIYLTLDINF